ncbi:uncharacterized protein [Glycine max]|uniref:uncharacterized protein n=1 Tax=Glycine max TaxID=3847 RepID=UPI0007191D2C|nr:uncharacterized protein LOC100777121 [Glycine max]|eukprot:XP_014632472.1 uncharacterized protein LOC100777121 [Glycine max]
MAKPSSNAATATGGITIPKERLIEKSGNVAACKKTPPNAVEELKEYMVNKKSGTTYNSSGSGNMANIRYFEFGEPIGCDGSEDEFADSCNATAKTKCGTKKGAMDKFCKNPKNAINRRKMEMLRQMNIRESMDKNEVLKVHQYIARFWYQAGLSFNLIKLKSFENMVVVIGQYGPYLPIPSYYDIRVPLLKKEVEYTKNLMKGHRAMGQFVDGFDFVKTGEKLFELLDAIVEEVGEENVVQVVTDNGSNYVLADIEKLPLIRKTIRREINQFGFIYAHSSTLSLLKNFTNKRELVRHAITRFATSYLTLERLHKEKANIRKMFTSNEWTLNKLSKEPKGKEAAKVVLMPSFWNSVIYTLKVMAPLVKVLRLVDGERKPVMDYFYEAMDKAKETIIKSFNNNESKYKDVFAIIDKRWNCQLHRPLHAAAHFLNPKFFYDNIDLDFDFEVTNGLFDCIKKLVPQFDVQQKILTELHLYKIGAKHFGSDFTMAQRKIHSPNDDALNRASVYEASGVGECRMYTRRKKMERNQPTSVAAAAQTSKKRAIIVGSSSRKQNAIQENDEDLDFEKDIELESEEEEIMVNFEAYDGEEGEGDDAPLSYDNNEDDYVGIGEDD